MAPLLILLPWAFTAGAVATLNPCGFALLPAYLSYLLGRGDTSPVPRQVVRGGLAGLSMTAGVMAVFLIAGAVITGLGTAIARFIPWLGVLVGGVVAAIGLVMLFWPSVNPSLPIAHWADRFGRRTGPFTFVAFGASYGLASLGCTLPVFLVVTAQALAAGGFLPGLLVFLTYALGMGAVLLTLSFTTGAGSALLVRSLRRLVPAVRWLGAGGMVVAGAYLIYYQVAIGRLFSQGGL
jgi:cytochrome c biogenesis protein CcdA